MCPGTGDTRPIPAAGVNGLEATLRAGAGRTMVNVEAWLGGENDGGEKGRGAIDTL